MSSDVMRGTNLVLEDLELRTEVVEEVWLLLEKHRSAVVQLPFNFSTFLHSTKTLELTV